MDKIRQALRSSGKPLSIGTHNRISQLSRNEILQIDPQFPNNVIMYPRLDIALYHRIATRFGMNNVEILWSLRAHINYADWLRRIPLNTEQVHELCWRFTLIMLNEQRNYANWAFLMTQLDDVSETTRIVHLIELHLNENANESPNYHIGLINGVLRNVGINRNNIRDADLNVANRVDAIANQAGQDLRERWFGE